MGTVSYEEVERYQKQQKVKHALVQEVGRLTKVHDLSDSEVLLVLVEVQEGLLRSIVKEEIREG